MTSTATPPAGRASGSGDSRRDDGDRERCPRDDSAAGARVAALLAQLTVAEKIALLHQHQPAVERLGLAAFHTGCEALHGVAWIGRATVFPQAVGLGASWDRTLLRRVGEAVSTEVRAFRQDAANAVRASGSAEKPPMVSLNVWAPVVNPLRDPRWGRNEEGYSEDAFATAQLATAYCRGLRGDHPRVWRTAPVLKHFLAYNVETDRAALDVRVPDRVLYEYELPAFHGPIAAGVAAGVMPGYNLTNGVPNHVHPLLKQALRAWGADLAVCSDAQAPSNLVDIEHFFGTHVESHAAALKAGVDSFTDNSADSAPTIERFTAALKQGLINEADLDAAVGRILLLRARTGEFDPADDPYTGIRADVIDQPAHRALAREAAAAAIVLLKNEAGALPLPLGPDRPGAGGEAPRVAVIGHLGSRVLTDWYSGSLPYYVSIAEGLATELGADRVRAVDGADLVRLHALTGAPDAAVFGPFRHQDWGTSVQCPEPVHTLQAVVGGGYLTLTGELDTQVAATAATPDGWFVKELWEFPAAGGVSGEGGEAVILLRSNAEHSRKYARVEPGTGRLVADAADPADATPFRLELVASGTDEAVAAAREADRVVVVLGNDPHINGRETVDRDGLTLPPAQERLLHAVVAANPDTVLVLVSSYPYAVDWAAREVPAIMWTAHGGQELGTAVARALTGADNPAGRLPQTWYSDRAKLPDPADYDIAGLDLAGSDTAGSDGAGAAVSERGWTYQYSRHERLFPFGHGLSYTSFSYSDISARIFTGPQGPDDGDFSVVVEFAVANTGSRAGQEVPQLYSRRLAAQDEDPADRPPLLKLQGFERIGLAAGEARALTFRVPAERLAQWSAREGRLVVRPGEYEFAVGGSSADLRVVAKLTLGGAA